MRTKELSEYLREVWGIQLAPPTLHKLRCQGGGVPFHMDGKNPVSTPAQADAFSIERLGPERRSTSDTGQAAIDQHGRLIQRELQKSNRTAVR
jgi:hypothetical protein